MSKIKNLELINKFVEGNSKTLFINTISEEINYFYLHYIEYLTDKFDIKLVQNIDGNNQTEDLFEQQKITYMFENIKSKIDQLKDDNYKKIIFTKYSNYKIYINKYDCINTYQYTFDVKYLLEDIFKINNNNLLNYCQNRPYMVFEEINKYKINQVNHLVNSEANTSLDNLADIRKSFYENKSKKNNLQEQYEIIKKEVLLKKFNFLIY